MIKKNSLSRETIIYLIAWIIYMNFYMICKQTEFGFKYNLDGIFKLVQYGVIVLLLVKIIFIDTLWNSGYYKKEIFFYIIIITLTLLIEIKNSDLYLLILTLFVIGSRKIQFENIIRYDFISRIILLLFVIIMCKIGVIDNYMAVINGSYKEALGFSHPNTLGIFVAIILIEYLYFKFYKLKIMDIIITFIGVFWIYNICAARTSVYTLVLFIFLFYLFSKFPFILKNKLIQQSFIWLSPICAVFSFYIAYRYKTYSEVIINLNKILTGRIALAYEFLERYGISMLGKEIETIGTRASLIYGRQSKILDCAYIKFGIVYGIPMLILLCIGGMYLNKMAIKKKNIKLLLCSSFFIVLGIAENYYYILGFNFTIIALIHLNNFVYIENKKIIDKKT